MIVCSLNKLAMGAAEVRLGEMIEMIAANPTRSPGRARWERASSGSGLTDPRGVRGERGVLRLNPILNLDLFGS